MPRKVIQVRGVPEPAGAYSLAIRAGDFIFVAGLDAYGVDGAIHAPGDAAAQAEMTCRNLQQVLAEAGASLDDVVKTTVFLTDMRHFDAVNAVYRRFFGQDLPARSCVRCDLATPEMLVEIEAVAYAPLAGDRAH